MRARRVAAASLVAMIALPASLLGQPVAGLSGSIELAQTRLARETGTTRILSGPVFGAQGRIALRLVEFEGRYSEGGLSPIEGTTGLAEDLVEGTAVIWLRPRPWIAVGGGPQLRAFISPSGTSHWTRFDLRTRLTADVIPGLAVAHVEGWVAAAVTSNVQGGGSGAQGAEAGLTIRIPRFPLSARVGYVADRATFANGGSEFTEGIRLSLMIGPF